MSREQEKFPQKNTVPLRFASFQQNDEYAIGQFVRFAYCKGYSPKEIAVLSEGDTAYGNISGSALPSAVADHGKDSKFKLSDLLHPYCTDGQTEKEFDGEVPEIVHLAFPREISFFRSAYQKEQASRQESLAKIPGKSAIPLNLDDEGDEGDAVPPFAGPQTALSQEAVMLGVVSELQKHHIKFTILLATNPVDQLFLARYLRTSYPQGRVVVTTPDLLLVSQEDTLLQGVLGLNVYSLVPGQNDLLGGSDSAQSRVAESVGNSGRKIQHKAHQDRLFESATDVGTFNATLALLAAGQIVERTANARKDSPGHPQWDRTKLPPADYAEYAAPCRREPSTNNSEECPSEPMLWLTILGADGYWPIAALSDQVKKSDDPRLPISYAISGFPLPQQLPNTLLTVESAATPGSGQAPHRTKEPSHTTPAWKVAYSLCVLAFLIHAILSCTGSFLSSSEAQAQFANTREKYRSLVVATGAVILVAAFVLIRCARSPLVSWRGGHLFDAAFWAPLPLFVGVICWDLIARRRAAMTAAAFFATASAVTAFQVSLATEQIPLFPFLWSTRYLHFTSAVSPIPPFFFLLVACYWWTWLSLRGMSIVDLRRPRLPSPSTLPSLAARMSDQEGEKVRDTAHPVKFAWKILIVILAVALVSITLLDLRHPLQSLEGFVYDWGYCALLAVAIAVYLGCLIRLTTTWFSYKQVLAGLDRSPLREAFSRMKRLSWKSLWNPGGSTLRETYRVMSRTFENLEKLEPAIPNSAESKHIRASIKDTNTAYFEAIAIYGRLLHATEPSSASAPGATTESSSAPASTVDASAAAAEGDSPAPQAARVAVPQGVSYSVPSAAMASAAGVAPVVGERKGARIRGVPVDARIQRKRVIERSARSHVPPLGCGAGNGIRGEGALEPGIRIPRGRASGW